MAEARRCPQCGAELPGDAPEGVCPKCLLAMGLGSQHDSQAGPEPVDTTPRPTRFIPPGPEQLAECFPQLEILELVGSGGMGAVYKARQPGLDRLVALKILPPEVGRDPAFAERFTREARAMARLGHPNIVAVYDFGQVPWPPLSPEGRGAGGQRLYYFVMEFVEGVNLRQMIQAGRLEPREALAIVPQICEALQFAHDQGVVHRDIKPENVLIDRRGRVKIADFGLAKLLGKAPAEFTLTGTGQVLGTPHYMAPEQMERPLQVDHRADIYSLGVVFYEMLTGELPIGRFAPPSKKVHVDVRLDEVVLLALENEPERRYQHASDVKADVDTIASSDPGSSDDRGIETEAALSCENGFVPGWVVGWRLAAAGVCLLGTALILLPWVRVRTVHNPAIDPKYIFEDGTFHFFSGIWSQQLAHGYDLWQGWLIGGAFFAMAGLLLGTLPAAKPAAWRYTVPLIAAPGIIFLATCVITEQPHLLGTPVQWAREPPEFLRKDREQQGDLSDTAFLRVKISEDFVTLESQTQPGPYASLALASCLLALGLVEFCQYWRARRSSRVKTGVDSIATGTEPPPVPGG